MRALHHNFDVIAPMIMKFGTSVKLDVFYTMATKKFVTSLLLRYYDVTACILAMCRPKFQMLVTPKPLTDFAENWYFEVFWGAFLKNQLRFYF